MSSNCDNSWSSKLNDVVCPSVASVTIVNAGQADYSFKMPDNAGAYKAELITSAAVKATALATATVGATVTGSFTGLTLNLAEDHYLRLTFYVPSPNQCLIEPV